MMPVRSWLISAVSSPESTMAWSMATWFQAEPPPWKRMARRSTTLAASSVGTPPTRLRKPCSANSGTKEMPDFASCSEDSTSCVLLPMDETMPIPVTTTRLMLDSPADSRTAGPEGSGGAPL